MTAVHQNVSSTKETCLLKFQLFFTEDESALCLNSTFFFVVLSNTGEPAVLPTCCVGAAGTPDAAQQDRVQPERNAHLRYCECHSVTHRATLIAQDRLLSF